MFKQFTLTTSLIACLFSAPTIQAEDFISLVPLARDFVSTSPGGEAAIPIFKFGDANSDGKPDLSFNFNVFTAGTKTKLFSTPVRTVVIPPLPCTQPGETDKKWTVKFLGAGTRIHALIQLEIGCWDNADSTWKDAYRAFVYSTDASKAAGATWAQRYDNSSIGLDGVDWDNDGTTELMLSLESPTSTGGGIRILFLHPVTGTVESDKTYAAITDTVGFMD